MEKVNYFVFDACGLITFLRNEQGAEKAMQLFADEEISFFMHAITLGEVYYDTLRMNKNKAMDLFETVNELGIQIIRNIDEKLIKVAADFKVNNKMSYADSFVLALAEINNAQIITTDHHEFDAVEKNSNLKFYWLR